MMEWDPEDFVDQQSCSDFTTTMVHTYRAEIQRSYNWRNRLDTTTNWAIVLLSAVITWTFTAPANPQELIIFSLFFIVVLLGIEARRYLYYNVWNSRVRALEADFIARTIDPELSVTSREWMKALAEDLQYPHFKIPYWHAVANRLRRIYVYLFSITYLMWLGKLYMHPDPATDISQIITRAEFFTIPGNIILAFVTAFVFVSIVIAVKNPHYEEDWDVVFKSKEAMEYWRDNM